MCTNNGSSIIAWIMIIQQCGRKGRLVLKVPVKDIDQRSNPVEKVFVCMRHGALVSESSNLEFLPKFFQFQDNRFGLVGHRISEVFNFLTLNHFLNPPYHHLIVGHLIETKLIGIINNQLHRK